MFLELEVWSFTYPTCFTMLIIVKSTKVLPLMFFMDLDHYFASCSTLSCQLASFLVGPSYLLWLVSLWLCLSKDYHYPEPEYNDLHHLVLRDFHIKSFHINRINSIFLIFIIYKIVKKHKIA